MLYSSLRKNTRPTSFSYCLLTNLIQLNFPFERVVRQHITCFFTTLHHETTFHRFFAHTLMIKNPLLLIVCHTFRLMADGAPFLVMVSYVAWILPVGWRSPVTDSWWHPVKLPTLRKWWKHMTTHQLNRSSILGFSPTFNAERPCAVNVLTPIKLQLNCHQITIIKLVLNHH